jgi:hypothetical protein
MLTIQILNLDFILRLAVISVGRYTFIQVSLQVTGVDRLDMRRRYLPVQTMWSIIFYALFSIFVWIVGLDPLIIHDHSSIFYELFTFLFG